MIELYAHFFFLQTAARNVPTIREKFFSALFTTQEYGVWETSMSPRGGHPKWGGEDGQFVFTQDSSVSFLNVLSFCLAQCESCLN